MATKGRNNASEGSWLLKGPFRGEGLAGWIADVPEELHLLTDDNAAPYRSRLRLFEDDRLLGPAHSVHTSITASGRGAYSFWQTALYFSTSDSTDPNTNGRSYRIQLPAAQAVAKESDAVAPELSWSPPPRLLRCAVVGLGNRGLGLANLAQSFEGVEISWVVDRTAERLAEAPKFFGTNIKVTTNVSEALADDTVDVVFVTVPDHLHREVAEPAFDAGKHVFLEKPLATNASDAIAILSAWHRSGRILQLGYVLRQAPFYAAIRKVVQDGLLGSVRVANLSEQLDVRHGGSFMRRWHASSRFSGGMLVHKGCHDLDILCWVLDAMPRRVSSFGGLDSFAREPPAAFCSQCAERETCPYVDSGLHERRVPAEAADPTAYGLDRCVFHPDKDIVDNQVVSFELNNGTRGSFSLTMQGPVRSERRISLVGDLGTLDGTFEDGRFVVMFTDRSREPYAWMRDARSRGGHGGGDRVTMLEFLNACVDRAAPPVTSSEEAIRGLVFALAAERARTSGKVVTLTRDDFGLSP